MRVCDRSKWINCGNATSCDRSASVTQPARKSTPVMRPARSRVTVPPASAIQLTISLLIAPSTISATLAVSASVTRKPPTNCDSTPSRASTSSARKAAIVSGIDRLVTDFVHRLMAASEFTLRLSLHAARLNTYSTQPVPNRPSDDLALKTGPDSNPSASMNRMVSSGVALS